MNWEKKSCSLSRLSADSNTGSAERPAHHASEVEVHHAADSNSGSAEQPANRVPWILRCLGELTWRIDTVHVNLTGSAEQPAFIPRRETCDVALFA